MGFAGPRVAERATGHKLGPDSHGGVPLLHPLYTLHVSILPALFLLVVALHLLLVKRHGMARSPFRKGPDTEPTEHFTRHLARRGGFTLVLVAIVGAIAVLAPPGHGPLPKPA